VAGYLPELDWPAAAGPAGPSLRTRQTAPAGRWAIRLELKLCKALAALDPPDEMSTLLHARIADLLRKLRRHDAIDATVRPGRRRPLVGTVPAKATRTGCVVGRT
jgi:hypothetical protein